MGYLGNTQCSELQVRVRLGRTLFRKKNLMVREKVWKLEGVSAQEE